MLLQSFMTTEASTSSLVSVCFAHVLKKKFRVEKGDQKDEQKEDVTKNEDEGGQGQQNRDALLTSEGVAPVPASRQKRLPEGRRLQTW